MSCVLPGAAEVLATSLFLQSILINDDLPTLLRPIKAYSGRSGLGHMSTDGLLMTYDEWMISMLQSKAIAV